MTVTFYLTSYYGDMRLCGHSQNKPSLLNAKIPKGHQIFLQSFSFESILPVRLRADTCGNCKLKSIRRARFVLQQAFGGVAKWTKATVCKTVIHGFESHRRLLQASST